MAKKKRIYISVSGNSWDEIQRSLKVMKISNRLFNSLINSFLDCERERLAWCADRFSKGDGSGIFLAVKHLEDSIDFYESGQAPLI